MITEDIITITNINCVKSSQMCLINYPETACELCSFENQEKTLETYWMIPDKAKLKLTYYEVILLLPY